MLEVGLALVDEDLDTPALRCWASGRVELVTVQAPAGLLAASARRWAPLAKAASADAVWAESARLVGEDEDVFAKDSGPSSDGTRWITVHPHGRDQPGQAVKIRESKTEPGVWHVVAGAEGKLNYLKLTDVKTPEEYKARAAEKRKQRKEAAAASSEEKKRQRSLLTPEEREAAKADDRLEADKRQQAEEHLEVQKREFVANIAQSLGWPESEWKFDATRARLEKSSTDPKRIEQLEKAHFKRLYTKAMDAVKATRRQLLLDHEMRAAAELGEVPLHTDDAAVVALADLEPDKAGKGLGYKRDVQKRSDAALTTEMAAADVERLKGELATAQEEFSPDDMATVGRVSRLRQDLHVATVMQQYGEAAPEELVARDQALAEDIQDVRAAMSDYLGELRQRRQEFRETGEEDPELAELEARYDGDTHMLEQLARDRDDVAILQGRQGAAVKGEKGELAKKRQADREREIHAEHGEEGVLEYRAQRAAMEAGLAKYRTEVAALKAAGAVKAPAVDVAALQDPHQAAAVLKHAKAIQQLERGITKAVRAEAPIDEKLYGKPYMVDAQHAALDAAVQKDLANDLAEMRTRAFLTELEEGEHHPTLADLTSQEKRESLERHVSAGAYNALNTASLAILQGATIGRDVADVLGAAGTAQLLARAIRQAKPDDVDAIRSAVEDYHLVNHLEQSEDAVREARDLVAQAQELAAGAAQDMPELAALQELNGQRRALLLQARQRMGTTLGEMEAHAALAMALRQAPADTLHVPLGPVAPEAAIRQARAIGLGRDDYTLDGDGTNHFLTVKASGLDKLVTPVDPAELAATETVLAIKRGEHDEQDWLPPGLTTRPQSSFENPASTLPPFGAHQMRTRPVEQWGQGEAAGLFGGGAAGDPIADLEAHIGARIADGEHADRVIGSVVASLSKVPAEHRAAIAEHLDKIVPTTIPLEEHGRPVWKRDAEGKLVTGPDGERVQASRQVLASHHQEALNGLAEKYVAKHFGSDPTMTAFHAQGLRMDTPAEAKQTAEAMHRAIAADPRAIVAFKDPAEMTPQDKAALRHYFDTELAKGQTGVDQGKQQAQLEALGPEPARDGGKSLFGEAMDNPEWTAWNQRRQAIASTGQSAAGHLDWDRYITMHKSVRHAYEALQDHMKGRFVERFAGHYAAAHGTPLRVGQRRMRNAERHLAALDPEARKALQAERDQLANTVKGRSGSSGRYTEGSYKEKLDRVAQAEQIADQNQVELAPADGSKDRAGWHRTALGERAENQIKSLMGNVGANFRHQMDQPVTLTPNFKMSGSVMMGGQAVDVGAQQRTIKAFRARKRLGAFLGVGSGKSAISIGAFTSAASDPSSGVKRGLWVVPAHVQGQFHGEMANYVEPGRFRWHSAPGASADERLAAHQDPDTHMVVQTHQGLRDDMLKLIAAHQGKSVDDVGPWFMGLPRAERAQALKQAWQHHGIDYQASFVDEGHVTVDRKGKPDSLLSAVMGAVSDTTSHYMAMTADPAKNDVSEIRSQLDKLHPDGRYGDEAAWHQRYGLNTSASREALRREVAGHFVINHIEPKVETRHAEHQVALHPEQHRAYQATLQHYQRARVDRAKGRINVVAIQALSPSSFATAPAAEHEAIARRLSDNLGMLKEAALHRVVNMPDPAHNAKLHKIRALLKDHPVKDKPVVIFAHNLEAVDQIHQALTADGHRVTKLTGALSGKEKDAARRAFAPKGGEDPKADIMVLSDAGATGLNLQRGQTLIHYDTPMTAMVHAQRNGRIRRLGQTQDVDLIDLVTDTPFEARARRRLEQKYDLRSIFGTDAVAAGDDSSLGGYVARAVAERQQQSESHEARATGPDSTVRPHVREAA